MVGSRKYAGMLFLLLLCLILKISDLSSSGEELGTFRGADLKRSIWNPLIADNVNEKEISILIDNKKLTSSVSPIFMDENLNLMLPVSVLRDHFNCSVHLYQNERLLIEKHGVEIAFAVGEPMAEVNMMGTQGVKEELSSPMVYENSEYYVPAEEVSKLLDFSYDWNMEGNQAVIVNKAAAASIFPAYYDLREKLRTPIVKNQGTYGNCWAFAALSAMESALLPEETYEFSPDHMSFQNHFYLEQTDGGEYTMGMAYLAAWQGPVYEREDPYGDNFSPERLLPVKHVQEIQVIDGKNFEKIKEAVFKYGGVQTSIYSALTGTSNNSMYYNGNTNSYCYIGTEKPNHDVLIIGWDDNYPKDNFNLNLGGNGAFICQNSWGSEFGEDGVFYISYYDVNIGIHNVVYTKIEDADNYDNIYQSDLCGWVGQLGYNKESIYGANVYTANRAEELKAAGFYATGKDTEYRLYIVKDFKDVDSLYEFSIDKKGLVAEGKTGNAGFYTINFNKSILVEEGEKYAMVLYVSTPGSIHPLAIEYNAGIVTSRVDISDGEGYISSRGNHWERVEDTQKSNLCIKVYSDNQ